MLRHGDDPPGFDPTEDGFGQGALDELRWHWRFLRHRWTDIPWRRATREEEHHYSTVPPICRFGDFTVAIADFEGMRWVIKERVWSGWPDPATYAIFVLKGEDIWMARDFEYWPRAWRKPWKTDEIAS